MKILVRLFALVQSVLAIRVFARMARTANGTRIERFGVARPPRGLATVIVPVLNEAARIGPCLTSLTSQDDTVHEILVVDGGSTDGTVAFLRDAARRDQRIRIIETGAIPPGVNGKAFGLMRGVEEVTPRATWILTVDADVRLTPEAVAAIVDFAEHHRLRAMSVASSQSVRGGWLGLLHPAMLTTLVYRFGIPGHATRRVDEVQANGQCFLVERELLEQAGGFESVLGSICEDVTLARRIASAGEPVGFYEADHLVRVEMHANAWDAWRNWPRSLPMRDRYSGWRSGLGLIEVLLVQAAPIWLLLGGFVSRKRANPVVKLQVALVLGRLGVLKGTARAYPNRPWTYWLSPLADLPVALEIIRRSRQRSHRWRGRSIVDGEQI